ncbi:hypothetical protein Tco_1542488, partial [Tanacetum coccineum]
LVMSGNLRSSSSAIEELEKPPSYYVFMYIVYSIENSHRGRTKSLSDGIPIKHRKVSFYLLGYRRRGTV